MRYFDKAEQSPTVQLIQNVDFRVESLQQMIAGRLMPGRRRVKIIQNRRQTLNEKVLNGNFSQSRTVESDFGERAEQSAPDTSGQISTETEAESDSEDTPEAGATHSEEVSKEELTDSPESQPANIPSMSKAGIQR